MPEYLAPGVYVEEVSSGIKPIEAVGTSTGAFVGGAVKGPVAEPVLVTSFTQFVDVFGGFHPDHYLAYAVRQFFTQGGGRCFVVRAFRPSPPASPPSRPAGLAEDVAFVTLDDGASPPVDALRVLASSPGAWGNDVAVEVTGPTFDPADPANADGKFGLAVLVGGEAVETYDRLSLNEFTADGLPNPLHAEQVINGRSKYIVVDDLSAEPTVTDPPGPGTFALSGGADGGTLAISNLIGAEAAGTGLFAFDTVDDINIVAIPDLMRPTITAATALVATGQALAYCEGREDCFFVADVPDGLGPTDALDYKQAQGAFSAGNALSSTYGALYYPWVRVADPVTGGTLLVPPSGSVAGVYARTDIRRGVHKAPAGTEDGRLRAVAGLERAVTHGEQELLNPNGVNVIRKFPDAGIVVWGARTVSADPEWRYVNVRRLFLFLEESIFNGTQWVVFEPNDPVLWKRITRNVSAFLNIQWREGKLVGETPEEAFFVKCDAETNPPESVDLGRVITVIGVAPSKPAEFVIFRITQVRPGAES